MAGPSSALARPRGEALRLQLLPPVRVRHLPRRSQARRRIKTDASGDRRRDRRAAEDLLQVPRPIPAAPRPRPTEWGVGGQNLEVRKMPRDGALTLSDVRQLTLSIVREPCGRRGAYKVARLMEQHGDAKLTDLLQTCPKARSASIHDRCKAVFEGLAV